jgi:hypothetical protein
MVICDCRPNSTAAFSAQINGFMFQSIFSFSEMMIRLRFSPASKRCKLKG